MSLKNSTVWIIQQMIVNTEINFYLPVSESTEKILTPTSIILPKTNVFPKERILIGQLNKLMFNV